MLANGSLIQRIFDLAFNQGDMGILDELTAADYVTHLVQWGMPANRVGLKLFITAFRTAFPDLQCTVEDQITEGDKFAARWTLRGTHTGSFLGNPPTGRTIAAKGTFFAITKNGRIVEDWIFVDQLGMLQQLGIVPPPGN